ncbi:MAG: hypothetical protein IAI50_02450 [Candidatus Eremiobacteraeota bacterium]|nr:hypothetical protein [Candidatus Eremiobacteraeota bacterium]
MIMVTSAQAGDGKSVTAYSLARCLAEAGHRIALVGAPSGVRNAPEGGPTLLPMPSPERGRFREATSEFLSSSRSTYDYTILDTAPLLEDTLALALSGVVDGVLVAVRMGRAPTEDDESMMRIIEQSNGRVLGIVAALPEAIDDFEQRRTGGSLREPQARRPVPAAGVAAMQSLQSIVVGMAVLFFSSLYALSSSDPGALHRFASVQHAPTVSGSLATQAIASHN